MSQISEFTGQIEHAADCILANKIESDFFDEKMHLEIISIIEKIKAE